MARPLRIAYPDALYHLTSRGNDKKNIFFSDDDRLHFLRILAKTVERFTWNCFSYCLMDNHFHLLVQTVHANVSQGMKYLNGVFTQYMNWKHKRVGHLLQGRFNARLIEPESYFLEVVRYVELNPVRAGICNDAGDYPWSSYQAKVGRVSAPSFLSIDPVLERFGNVRQEAQKRYEQFVREGVDEKPFDKLRGIFLGSDAFVEKFQDLSKKNPKTPLSQIDLLRPSLEQLLHKPDDLLMAKELNYSTREMAQFLNTSQSAIVRRLKQLGSGPN